MVAAPETPRSEADVQSVIAQSVQRALAELGLRGEPKAADRPDLIAAAAGNAGIPTKSTIVDLDLDGEQPDPNAPDAFGLVKRERSRAIGALVRSLIAAKGDRYGAAQLIAQTYGKESKLGGAVVKALGSADPSAGGFLVPEQWSLEVIEFLRPLTIVRASGPTVLPMPAGNLRVPRINTGASASYIGEAQNVPATQQIFGQVTLNTRKLASLVPISNDLLRYANPAADTLIRDDLARGLAQGEDSAFIRAVGSDYTPKGIRYWAAASNVTASAASGATDAADMIVDLRTLEGFLEDANVRFIRPGWMMSPRTKRTLMTIQNTQGFYLFRQEMTQLKTLWGYPFRSNTLIPTNLGSGSDSELYLVDFADIVIGDTMTLRIDTSVEASYYDGSNLQSAFSQDLTLIRGIAEHDIVARHDQSIGVLTGVKY